MTLPPSRIAFESTAQLVEHSHRGLDVSAGDPSRQPVDPHLLLGIERLVLGAALLGQADERRPPVIRVVAELREAVADEAIHAGVHALSCEAHSAGDLRHGERPLLQGDRAEHLPAGGCEPLVCAQPVPGVQQQSVRPERGQDEFRGGLPGGRSPSPHIVCTLTICKRSVKMGEL
jgi:hypothetical protein